MKKQIIPPHLIDINTAHDSSFKIDRKRDPQRYNLVMCFRTPAVILTFNGKQTAQPGDCIIHSIDFYQYHCSVPNAASGFRNDWAEIHPDVISPLMKDLKLPWDTLIQTGEPEIIAASLKRLQEELNKEDDLSERAMINQIEDMLIIITRCHRQNRMLRNNLTVSERRYYQDFVILRTEILENYHKQISIKKLAAKVNLSKERFNVLYRKFFSKTPYAELLDTRLIHAQRLLLNSFMEVKEISEACGWDDLHYFSRLFKKKMGVPPTLYRKNLHG